MRRMIIFAAVAVLASFIACFSLSARAGTSAGYRTVDKMLERYESISEDLPLDRIAALEQLRDTCLAVAAGERTDDFRVDEVFYRVITDLRGCRTSINWKDRDRASAEFSSALASYPRPYPVARYLLCDGGRYVSASGLDLESQRKRFGDSWPVTAESMLTEQETLRQELWQVRTSDDALVLRDKCRDFCRRLGGLKGIDARFTDSLSGPEDILRTLDTPVIDARVEDDVLVLKLRNLSSVRVRVNCPDPRYTRKVRLTNPSPRYYMMDTLRLALDGLHDGTYDISARSGKTRRTLQYERTSISVAGRWRDGRYEIYAADMQSGDPVRSATLSCTQERYGRRPGPMPLNLAFGSGNGNGGGSVPVWKGPETTVLAMDGFTALPSGWTDAVSDTTSISVTLSAPDADGAIRLSRTIAIGRDYPAERSGFRDTWRASLLTDCGAYHPGDEVRFKAVIYTSLADKTIRLCDGGQDVQVRLLNPKGEEVSSVSLVTSEMGSVDGSFVLPSEDLVTGRWSLQLSYEGRWCASRSLVVDQYVAPSFEVTLTPEQDKYYRGDTVVINGLLKSLSGNAVSTGGIRYTLVTDKEESGVLQPSSDGRFSITVPCGEDVYWVHLSVEVTDGRGETLGFGTAVNLVDREAEKREAMRPRLVATGRDGISARMLNVADGIWMVTEVWGPEACLLYSSLRQNDGDIDIPWPEEWPEEVMLSLLWFRDGEASSHSLTFSRQRPSLVLPMEWSVTCGEAAPGESTPWSLVAVPGAEVAVAVFDKATLSLAPNNWSLLSPAHYGPSMIHSDKWCGSHGSDSFYPVYRSGGLMRVKGAGAVMMDAMAMETTAMAASVNGDAVIEEESGDLPQKLVPVRSEMAEVLAFYPALRADADGAVRFEVPASDKLTTYVVRAFGHDERGRSAIAGSELVVRLDTEIGVLAPRFLYDGDRYVMHYTVSSRDTVTAAVRDFGVVSKTAHGDTLSCVLRTDALKGSAGDALQVSIPLKDSTIAVTEAHSALARSGYGAAALRDSLASAFANDVPDSAIDYVEETLLESVRAYLDHGPDGEVADNAVSLTAALYCKGADRSALLGRLHALRGADGGYSWMSGMPASAGITALVMERLYRLGLSDQVQDVTVHWLDTVMASSDEVSWYGGLSDAQYFYVRSMYAGVPYTGKRQHTGLLSDTGGIMFKARRILTLRQLSASDEGLALARKWGVNKLFTGGRLDKAVDGDVRSLRQYAVEHPSGGVYFPNAVMPWRGLQENEIYAHGMLCRVFSDDALGDGLRLWMMVQKQTQSWRSSPSMIEACDAILEGSRDVLQTRLVTASALVSTPIPALKASCNGMTVQRTWQVKTSGSEPGWENLSDGQSLRVGDRVRVVSKVWSEENRSFVRLHSPIPACLAPVDQLSGWRWWGCYRQVCPDAMEYYWDSYPEENLTLTEEYNVTQEGRFVIPEASVECLYAPAWRGNEGFGGYMLTGTN